MSIISLKQYNKGELNLTFLKEKDYTKPILENGVLRVNDKIEFYHNSKNYPMVTKCVCRYMRALGYCFEDLNEFVVDFLVGDGISLHLVPDYMQKNIRKRIHEFDDYITEI